MFNGPNTSAVAAAKAMDRHCYTSIGDMIPAQQAEGEFTGLTALIEPSLLLASQRC